MKYVGRAEAAQILNQILKSFTKYLAMVAAMMVNLLTTSMGFGTLTNGARSSDIDQMYYFSSGLMVKYSLNG